MGWIPAQKLNVNNIFFIYKGGNMLRVLAKNFYANLQGSASHFIREKIIDPVIKVNPTAIIGTNRFINLEDCGLETILGRMLFIFASH